MPRGQEEVMDDTMLQEKPGFFSRLASIFKEKPEEEIVEEEPEIVETHVPTPANTAAQLRQSYRYTVTVRRQIVSFEDAMAAANGIKRGEQQILNLSQTDPVIRQKIVDFMCGVNFAHEGTFEEVGEHIYLVAPSNAYIEDAPPTPRMTAVRN